MLGTYASQLSDIVAGASVQRVGSTHMTGVSAGIGAPEKDPLEHWALSVGALHHRVRWSELSISDSSEGHPAPKYGPGNRSRGTMVKRQVV